MSPADALKVLAESIDNISPSSIHHPAVNTAFSKLGRLVANCAEELEQSRAASILDGTHDALKVAAVIRGVPTLAAILPTAYEPKNLPEFIVTCNRLVQLLYSKFHNLCDKASLAEATTLINRKINPDETMYCPVFEFKGNCFVLSWSDVNMGVTHTLKVMDNSNMSLFPGSYSVTSKLLGDVIDLSITPSMMTWVKQAFLDNFCDVFDVKETDYVMIQQEIFDAELINAVNDSNLLMIDELKFEIDLSQDELTLDIILTPNPDNNTHRVRFWLTHVPNGSTLPIPSYQVHWTTMSTLVQQYLIDTIAETVLNSVQKYADEEES